MEAERQRASVASHNWRPECAAGSQSPIAG
jgi:hypothetical protein